MAKVYFFTIKVFIFSLLSSINFSWFIEESYDFSKSDFRLYTSSKLLGRLIKDFKLNIMAYT